MFSAMLCRSVLCIALMIRDKNYNYVCLFHFVDLKFEFVLSHDYFYPIRFRLTTKFIYGLFQIENILLNDILFKFELIMTNNSLNTS